MKQEDIFKLLSKLKAQDHFMRKMGHKPRKTKPKSVFRIFNINKLFNPAGFLVKNVILNILTKFHENRPIFSYKIP